MKTLLIVVDMQNDFVTGALGSKDAEAILPAVNRRIEEADRVVYTLDTHGADYLSTQEGQKLPVAHCIKGTWGHALADGLQIRENAPQIEKPAFGSAALGEYVRELFDRREIDAVELIGLCTDICVISNAMLLKAVCPELPVSVRADCCAGVSPLSHQNALEAMKVCQIGIL
ncbi:MAG: cysteine hydrolase [Oscillospiraceae bacterium]|nr:cysteine hydrolase [Oscillospiraceae bacterium]